MKSFIDRNKWWFYFILAYLVSWPVWIVLLFCSSSLKTNAEAIVPSGCSVITVSKDGKVFFGGNDDYINPDSWYWVEKGDSSKYGVIWIGYPDNPQQGINEKGLAYDSNGLPRFDVNPHSERAPVSGEYYHNYVMQIMHECSSVAEVIDWINSHRRFPYMHDQMHFADKGGDAVIVSAGKDGELVFTRKSPGNSFLVSTNFNVANPSNGFGYPCRRFDVANELLGQLVIKEGPLGLADVVPVMDAMHEEASSWTIETLVADLTDGVMFLYFFFQYDSPVIINVREELANPRQAGPLSGLFPEDVRLEAAKRYSRLSKTIRMNNIIGRSWAAVILLSLVTILILPSGRKGARFWVPSGLILGPAALLAKLLSGKQDGNSRGRSALLETIGDIVPVTLAYLLVQVVLVSKALTGSLSQLQQLVLVLGLPVLSAWLIFHGPVLSITGRRRFFPFLFQRLPHVVVSVLLGLAGIFPVAMPLLNKTITLSQIMPLSPWIVMTWWALTAAGAVLGGILVYPYELWCVNKGCIAWSILAGDEGQLATPGLKKTWWWILLGLVLLIAGMAAGIILLKATSGT